MWNRISSKLWNPSGWGATQEGMYYNTHTLWMWLVLVARFLSFRVETIISHHIKGKYFHSLRFHPAAVIHNSWHDKFMNETSRRTSYTWLNFDIHGHGNRSLYFTYNNLFWNMEYLWQNKRTGYFWCHCRSGCMPQVILANQSTAIR